jgi:hypothetical protein
LVFLSANPRIARNERQIKRGRSNGRNEVPIAASLMMTMIGDADHQYDASILIKRPCQKTNASHGFYPF